MFQKKNNTILVLAPHTDDGEFGCGASINKFISEGSTVYYIAFTLAEESVPEPFPKNILETEVKLATSKLGIASDCLKIFRYKVRHFAYHRQEILENLVLLNKEINPSIVFMPSLSDLHQDHSTIATEGLRAFKKTTILSYEIPWNNINFSTQCFIPIDKSHLEKKIEALDCYNSQKNRSYASREFIESLAITRGTQIGVQYAEVFEVVRLIV